MGAPRRRKAKAAAAKVKAAKAAAAKAAATKAKAATAQAKTPQPCSHCVEAMGDDHKVVCLRRSKYQACTRCRKDNVKCIPIPAQLDALVNSVREAHAKVKEAGGTSAPKPLLDGVSTKAATFKKQFEAWTSKYPGIYEAELTQAQEVELTFLRIRARLRRSRRLSPRF